MSDDQIVLVNLDFVRAVEPIAGGLKLSFGNAASDSINIKAVTLEQLTEQMTP